MRDDYRALSRLQAYLIIDQRQVFVELDSRADNGWQLQTFSDIDAVIPLDAIGCDLPLAELYRGINFSDE